jgi:hypothetical protein
MIIAANRWLKIVEYRDFFDVPRYLLALDTEQKLWIMDCMFNEELDDYESDYLIFGPYTDLSSAQRIFDLRAKDSISPDNYVWRVEVKDVQFDSTKRLQCFIQTKTKDTHSFKVQTQQSH